MKIYIPAAGGLIKAFKPRHWTEKPVPIELKFRITEYNIWAASQISALDYLILVYYLWRTSSPGVEDEHLRGRGLGWIRQD